MRDIVLDFWRGVGILLVLAHHLVLFHYSWRGSEFAVHMFERAGPLGVRIFFVVSGYIITRLMLEEEHKHGTLSIYSFYVRRAFRILPPYIFYLLGITAFSWFAWIAVPPADVVTAGAFLCNTALPCGWFTVHTWTLAIEMQFYILWPLLFVVIPARRRPYFLTALLAFLLTLSALGVFVERGWIDNALSFACIAAGALYAASAQVRLFVERRGIAFVAAAVSAVVLLYVAGQYDIAHVIYRIAPPLLLPVIIFNTYRLTRIVESKLFSAVAAVGLVSYSLYLWQQVFVAPVEYYLAPSLLQYTVLMIAFCLFSYYVVEKPFIRLGKKLLHAERLRAKV